MDEWIYDFVEKDCNPPNVPQARPIKNFWGFLAHKVYEGGWYAKTEQQLVNRIKLQLKNIDANFLQSLMGGFRAKLRSIADNGSLGLFKKLF